MLIRVMQLIVREEKVSDSRPESHRSPRKLSCTPTRQPNPIEGGAETKENDGRELRGLLLSSPVFALARSAPKMERLISPENMSPKILGFLKP